MTSAVASVTLSLDELVEVTGHRRPADQLVELQRRGLFRAHMGRDGTVILERPHYNAVRSKPAAEAPAEVPAWMLREVPVRRYEGSNLQAYHSAQRAHTEAADAERRQRAIEQQPLIAARAVELRALRKRLRAALILFHSAKRRAATLLRTPPWADLKAIRAVYVRAALLTAESGQAYHVDHVVPLQGRKVSGLHVETNLQIILAAANVRKGNRFEVDAC